MPDGQAARGGVIVRVNLEQEYVIARFASPPEVGAQFRTFRDNRLTGLIRCEGGRRHPHYAATLISGSPRVGDLVAP
jgi:hypothetical protein